MLETFSFVPGTPILDRCICFFVGRVTVLQTPMQAMRATQRSVVATVVQRYIKSPAVRAQQGRLIASQLKIGLNRCH